MQNAALLLGAWPYKSSVPESAMALSSLLESDQSFVPAPMQERRYLSAPSTNALADACCEQSSSMLHAHLGAAVSVPPESLHADLVLPSESWHVPPPAVRSMVSCLPAYMQHLKQHQSVRLQTLTSGSLHAASAATSSPQPTAEGSYVAEPSASLSSETGHGMQTQSSWQPSAHSPLSSRTDLTRNECGLERDEQDFQAFLI